MKTFFRLCMVLLALHTVTGCGKRSSSSLKEAWNFKNAPIRLDEDTIDQFERLPLEGQVLVTPWSDTYWPNYKGGLAHRWNDNSSSDGFAYEPVMFHQAQNMSQEDLKLLSPAEKFDVFTGETSLVASERLRTKSSDPTWFGLCHGWAPASYNFKEPQAVVVTSPLDLDIPFSSSDIKALLIYASAVSGYSRILGDRCNIKLSEGDPAGELPQCRDVNAGSFHIILANLVGLKKQSFVAEVSRGHEVWNQPVSGFRSVILGESQEIPENAAPGTSKILTIQTDFQYIGEVSPSHNPRHPETSKRSRNFKYNLEIDEAGKIIGGEWISNDYPDFLWTKTRPKLDPKWRWLEYIYEVSTGDQWENPLPK